MGVSTEQAQRILEVLGVEATAARVDLLKILLRVLREAVERAA